MRHAAEQELAEVRRRRVELAGLESALVGVVAARWLAADRLLDERLAVARGVEDVLVAE